MPDSAPARHERSDLRVRPVVLTGIVLALAVGLVVVIAGALELLWGGGRPGATGRAIPSPPRLQAEPMTEAARLRREKQDHLNSYGWVDREAGIVHIPIERAMASLIQAAQDSAPGETRR